MSDCQVPCPLQSIDSAIADLEQIKSYLDGVFYSLNNKTQAEIDEIITTKINPYVNEKLSQWRSSLLKTLQDTYSGYLKATEPITTIAGMDATDLSSVIKLVKKIKEFIMGAYSALTAFVSLFPDHLSRLATAVTNIVSYTPPISVSFSALDIHCEPITMQDITGES